MHKASVENTFSMVPEVAGTFGWNGLRECIFTPTAPLTSGTTYKVTIGPAARTVSGVVLGKPFTWSFTTAAGTLAMMSASAAPTGVGGAQVSFTLSADARVEVVISNIAGRTVRRVVTDHAGVAGLNTLVWDGKADSGLRVPAGRYLVQVRARTEDGQQCQALAAVSLVR